MNKIQIPDLQASISNLETSLANIVLGKQDVARKCLVALFSGEHVLLEDVPGVGKTLMGKALARSIDGQFCRLQFTPDLLPSDIVGSSIFDPQKQSFVFREGPVFCNFVIADEINRAPPRTQSALLEAMGDGRVSVDGTTYDLPGPFMVIATQNPFEFEGTYVLPESQLDRFLLRISMGYPDREFEKRIVESHRLGQPVDHLEPVIDRQKVAQIQEAVRQVSIDPAIVDYMLSVVHATRDSAELDVGVSTRGLLLWSRAVQAQALLDGRDFVIPDDPKELAVCVLAHRVLLKGQSSEGNRKASEDAITNILDRVPLP